MLASDIKPNYTIFHDKQLCQVKDIQCERKYCFILYYSYTYERVGFFILPVSQNVACLDCLV